MVTPRLRASPPDTMPPRAVRMYWSAAAAPRRLALALSGSLASVSSDDFCGHRLAATLSAHRQTRSQPSQAALSATCCPDSAQKSLCAGDRHGSLRVSSTGDHIGLASGARHCSRGIMGLLVVAHQRRRAAHEDRIRGGGRGGGEHVDRQGAGRRGVGVGVRVNRCGLGMCRPVDAPERKDVDRTNARAASARPLRLQHWT